MTDIPNQLKFTKTHEWLAIEGQTATLGITAHAQELLGDLVFVELPEVGQTIALGEEMGVVESVKAASDLYAPISGTVTAVNEEVNENPALVNEDPYGKGWLVQIKADDKNELSQLLDATAYERLLAEEH